MLLQINKRTKDEQVWSFSSTNDTNCDLFGNVVKTNFFSQRGEVNAPHFHSFTLANFPHGLRSGCHNYYYLSKLGHSIRYVNS